MLSKLYAHKVILYYCLNEKVIKNSHISSGIKLKKPRSFQSKLSRSWDIQTVHWAPACRRRNLRGSHWT